MSYVPDRLAYSAERYLVIALHDGHVLDAHPGYSSGMAGSLVVEDGRRGNGERIYHNSSREGLDAARGYIAECLTAAQHPRSHDAPHHVVPEDIDLVPIKKGDLPAYAGQGWRAHVRGYDPDRALELAARAGESLRENLRRHGIDG